MFRKYFSQIPDEGGGGGVFDLQLIDYNQKALDRICCEIPFGLYEMKEYLKRRNPSNATHTYMSLYCTT